MRAALRVATLIAVCFLYGCGGRPGDIEITQQSQEAAILLQVDPADDLWYELEFTQYDVQKQKVNTDAFTISARARFFHINSRHEKFLVKRLKPGTYAATKFILKQKWTAEFLRDTVYFTVKPGEILYLGKFDPLPNVRDVMVNVAAKGEFKANQYSNFIYTDHISPPHLIPADGSERSLAEARQFVAAEMPQTRVDVRVASYKRGKYILD